MCIPRFRPAACVAIVLLALSYTTAARAQTPTGSASKATPARAAPASLMSPSDAVNRSGRQRMLSQRMAKAYAQLVGKTLPDRSALVLRESITQFDSTLLELERFAGDGEAKQHLVAQRKSWVALRPLLEKAPAVATLPAVLMGSDELLVHADRATIMLEKLMLGSNAGIVNLVGRERMISQQIARYFAEDFATQSKRNGPRIEAAAKLFANAIREIDAWPKHSTQTKDMIVLANSQWAFYTQAFAADLPGTPGALDAKQADNVAKASENLLQTLDNVTAAVSKLAE